jgi:hypothetical protein
MIALAIAPKLGKLIPLLASDKDGEVLAAARAIGRTLKSAKSDFHDLVAALTPAVSQETPSDVSDMSVVVQPLNGHPGLTAWETNFIASIARQPARRRPLTEKQRTCIMRAWERLQ